MIYGKSDEERRVADADSKKWHKVFIVFPKKMLDGRYAFLQKVERISYFSDEINGYEHVSHSLLDRRGWCYREIRE